MKKLFFIPIMLFVIGISTASAQVRSAGHDAAVGGVVGAGTGLIVGHKKGKSALIGGAVGAGAGYLYGKHRQHKYAPRRRHYYHHR